MQFFATVLALAAVAVAVPSPMGSIHQSECSASGRGQACCDGIAGCFIQVLGSNCKNEAYCCDGGKSVGGLINVSAANCLKLL